MFLLEQKYATSGPRKKTMEKNAVSEHTGQIQAFLRLV
jgi:hypothetical protein